MRVATKVAAGTTIGGDIPRRGQGVSRQDVRQAAIHLHVVSLGDGRVGGVTGDGGRRQEHLRCGRRTDPRRRWGRRRRKGDTDHPQVATSAMTETPDRSGGLMLSFGSAGTGIAMQNSTSMVFDTRQAPDRVDQSITATRYRKPRRIGMYVMSAHQTWFGRSITSSRSKYR
jgi:hypothetical protein